MRESHSALEWFFDILAAFGLLVAFISIPFREWYPNIDFVSLLIPAAGLLSFVGGVLGSQRCKQRRIAALVSSSANRRENAN